MLNLGIVAHVDAGKTSLTERLLYETGVLQAIGSVDDGSTQTDSLALERRRGITIKAAVVSFPIGQVTVNLLDTPGHPDFIAEVERVLGVLDGAVLVISAVEGVQPQTRILLRTLQRLRIPTLIFVNKVDRAGARYDGVLHEIAERLTPAIVAINTVRELGSTVATTALCDIAETGFRTRLTELLAERDEAVLAAYLQDENGITSRRLLRALRRQARQGDAHPVLFGSAITGAGVPELMAAITEFLPCSQGKTAAAPSGTVFKVERGAHAERIAYVRMFAGSLSVRDRLPIHGKEERVSGIAVFENGTTASRTAVVAGEIARVRGLASIRIGDPIGTAPDLANARHFAPPTLETVVTPRDPADRGMLQAALSQLAEQDPLIGLRQDELADEIAISLYGEVQKEVIQATLATEFGIEATFSKTATICVERVTGTGAAVEFIGTGGNPYLATVGLRVEPAPIGAGVRFGLDVELGSMPYAFFRAIEETVHATLRQGLAGWQVPDCTVAVTHTGYCPRQSHAHATFDKSMSTVAADFRGLTPLVLLAALRQAGTTVCEPLDHFQLEIPAATYGPMLPVLTRLRAVPSPAAVAGSGYLLTGTIPAAELHELRQRLPHLTGGEGVLEASFQCYQPAPGPVPRRRRSGPDPLDRTAYLMQVRR